MKNDDLKDFVTKNFVDELPDGDSKTIIHFYTMLFEIKSILGTHITYVIRFLFLKNKRFV